jgi:hypothetical protein
MLKLILCYFFLIPFIISKGQKGLQSATFVDNNCLSQTIFKTDSLGNRKEKLSIPLTFVFFADSLIVGNSLNLRKQFMAFRIEKKDSCHWNSDFTIGKTSYQLLMMYKEYTKHPRLNIIYEPSGKKYIEILYENSEERIFTIVRQQ